MKSNILSIAVTVHIINKQRNKTVIIDHLKISVANHRPPGTSVLIIRLWDGSHWRHLMAVCNLNLNTKKSTGYDNIPVKLLKLEQPPWLAYCHICLLCPLNNASFPMSLNLLMSPHSIKRPRGCVKTIIAQSASLHLFLKYSKVHSVINCMNFSTSFYQNCSLGSELNTVVKRY